MASVAGRGAQVRLDGDDQKAARGALAGSIEANAAAKAAMELAGLSSDGSTPDGSTRSGLPAEDEVLSGSGLDGSAAGAAAGSISGATAGAASAAPYATAAAASATTAADKATIATAAADNVAAAVVGAATQRATLVALTAVSGTEGQLGVVYNDGSATGQYRYLSGVWTYQGPTVPVLAKAVGALPIRKTGAGAVMALFLDRAARAFAGIDDSGKRWWVAGQQWVRRPDGSFRWQGVNATGSRLDLRPDGVDTDGVRVGFGGKALRAISLVSVGGLIDWFRVVDRTGRGVIRMGLGHIIAGSLRLIAGSDGATTLSGPRGVLLSQGATGGPLLPGRIGEGSFPGAHFILKWAGGRISALRIDPTDGALRLVGRSVASVTPTITETEYAALQYEAVAYADRLNRTFVDLHQPTEGLVLFFTYGQSLSCGQQGFPALSLTSPPDCYMIGNSVHAAALSNPVWAPMGGTATLNPLSATVRGTGDNTLLNPTQVAALDPNAGNLGETPLEGFAAQLRAAWLRSRGKPGGDPSNKWVFTCCGVGGRLVSELSVGASPEIFQRIRDAVTLGKAQATALGVSFSVGGVIYNQGESDYSVDTDYATYFASLTQLFADIRSYVAGATGQAGVLPIWMQQTGGNYASDTYQIAMARAQLQIARTVPGTYLVSNNHPYPDRGAHLGANGYRWMGCQMGKAAARTLIDRKSGMGAHMIRATWRSRTLVLLMHTPVAGLKFGSPYLGNDVAAQAAAASKAIYVEDTAGSVTISSVTLSGRLVIVTLGRDLVSTPAIWLGKRVGQNGVTVVTDADAERLVYPYTYTAGTGQWVEENITALVGLTYPTENFSLSDVQVATAL